MPSNDLIFTSGLPYLPTQNGWKLYHLWDLGVLNDDDGGVVRVWGSSVQNLYFAGREGTIVHYNGVINPTPYNRYYAAYLISL